MSNIEKVQRYKHSILKNMVRPSQKIKRYGQVKNGMQIQKYPLSFPKRSYISQWNNLSVQST